MKRGPVLIALLQPTNIFSLSAVGWDMVAPPLLPGVSRMRSIGERARFAVNLSVVMACVAAQGIAYY